ncbi:MAG TPA: hypothetical protein PK993_00930 [Clostridia bacterium]|nr:hypothetical protein [Clostridia bacterium]
MSKFCEGCGAEIDDAAVKCKDCVEKDTQEKNATAGVANEKVKDSATTKKPMNKAILFGGIGAAALAVIVLLIVLISNIFGGYKTPISNMYKGMQKADLKSYLKAYPEFMGMDKYIDQDDMDDMLKSLEKEYGKNIKISYKIIDTEKIKKDDLEKVKEKVSKYYDKDVKISEGYKVTVKSTIKGKDDSETDTDDMKVYKIDGKWYILGL